VPIDWSDQSNPGRVALALIKVPAKVPVTDPRYGGAVITNPGGPGNSGVNQILTGGHLLQQIVDSPREPFESRGRFTNLSSVEDKFFDLVSFDPRAVNNTTPHLKCFPDGMAELSWMVGDIDGWLYSSSEPLLDLAWARSKALGRSCSIHHGAEPNIAEYVNTPQVVQDIVAITERHGEWREKEAKKLLDIGSIQMGNEATNILARTKWNVGCEPLNFWGISYGTVLGQTLAAMHPDRVSRMIIDGVVDPEDYYTGSWLKNLQNTDQIIDRWADYCQAAGEKCPFLIPGLPSSQVVDLIAWVTGQLATNPLPIAASESHGPVVVDYTDMVDAIADALYESHRLVEKIGQIIIEMLHGNGTRLANRKTAGYSTPISLRQDCLEEGPFSEACTRTQATRWAQGAIVCGDSIDQQLMTKDEFRKYIRTLQLQSSTLGSTWSSIRLHCVGWQAKATWKFEGI
jgi:pimeloyl-ACP methyl ester carboxylesterase